MTPYEQGYSSALEKVAITGQTARTALASRLIPRIEEAMTLQTLRRGPGAAPSIPQVIDLGRSMREVLKAHPLATRRAGLEYLLKGPGTAGGRRTDILRERLINNFIAERERKMTRDLFHRLDLPRW
jgi:hypothetical protein